MKRKICFIINPISGIGKQKIVEPLIAQEFPAQDFEVQICYTRFPKHATEICQNAVSNNFETVVAIGGDGSVNEVAKGLIHTKVKLGIVPCGSGNGFARHLGIPIHLKKSLEIIRTGNSMLTDTVKANDNYFVNIAGLGFDAHVAHLFATSKTRGFSTYIKIVLREFFSCQEQKYRLEYDVVKEQEMAFIFSIANASQYGNNAFIAPLAKVDDGKFEVIILKKIPLFLLPIFVFRLFNKGLQNSRYYRQFSTAKLKVIAPSGKIHLDGEAVETNPEISFEVLPLSLKVLVP